MAHTAPLVCGRCAIIKKRAYKEESGVGAFLLKGTKYSKGYYREEVYRRWKDRKPENSLRDSLEAM